MSLKLNGATSGSIELDVPDAIGSDLNITIPATAGEVVVANTSGDVDLGSLTVSGSASDGSVNIDSSGRLLVGTSTARSDFFNNTQFNATVQVEDTSSSAADYIYYSAVRNTNDSEGPVIALGKSRGTTLGAVTVVQQDDVLGLISFQGADGGQLGEAARITAQADGEFNTGGDASDSPGRLVFSTTADGASSPTIRMTIRENGQIEIPDTYGITTTNVANVYINSNGFLRRSTSSLKYKTDVETLENSYADAILNCRPVWYRSTTGNDNPEWSWWGFIAEEVAEIDPRLVSWKTTEITYDEKGSAIETPLETPEPDGVQYDRFVPHLLNLIKRQQQAIETLEAKVAALEANQ